MKQKVLPIIDETQRSVRLVASIMERLERGEGALGRVLTNDQIVRDLEATMASAKESVDAIPALLRRVDKSLAEVQSISRDLARTTPQMPQIARNVEEASKNLPQLMLQTRATTAELQQLVIQLRSHWLSRDEADEAAKVDRSVRAL